MDKESKKNIVTLFFFSFPPHKGLKMGNWMEKLHGMLIHFRETRDAC